MLSGPDSFPEWLVWTHPPTLASHEMGAAPHHRPDHGTGSADSGSPSNCFNSLTELSNGSKRKSVTCHTVVTASVVCWKSVCITWIMVTSVTNRHLTGLSQCQGRLHHVHTATGQAQAEQPGEGGAGQCWRFWDWNCTVSLQKSNEEKSRKKENVSNVVVRKTRGRSRKILPVVLVPRTLEEAPLRRMDRRALNALRKRRADRHMIAFLAFIGTVMTVAGSLSLAAWHQLRSQYKFVGLLIIVGPILIIAGLSIFLSSLELVLRLRRQIQRVMDPSLLKTNNYHEVKHWIEPGLSLVVTHEMSLWIWTL